MIAIVAVPFLLVVFCVLLYVICGLWFTVIGASVDRTAGASAKEWSHAFRSGINVAVVFFFYFIGGIIYCNVYPDDAGMARFGMGLLLLSFPLLVGGVVYMFATAPKDTDADEHKSGQ